MKKLAQIAQRLIPERIPEFAAGTYARAARLAVATYYREVSEEIASHIDSGQILDVGTGPGYLPIEIAKRRPKVHIVGIDETPKMIDMAQRNAREAGLSHQLLFEVGDANCLRFEDNSYDMVISTGLLHSLKNPVGAINEWYRVLKPGRQAWVYDPARVTNPEADRSWLASLRGFDRLALLWVALTSKVMPLALTEGQVQEIIGDTRFTDYEIDANHEVRIKLKK
jgi:ubiquinone/menaquinone biosynthesis C-methylase UbiE